MKLFNKKLHVVKAVEPKKVRKPMMAVDIGSKFIYQSGADCTKIWKRYGYIPPTEYRDDYLFKLNREKDIQAEVENG